MKQPVIIGRFQYSTLTEGHRALFRAIKTEFGVDPIVLIGVSPLPCTPNNPLTFEQREYTTRRVFTNVRCYPLLDMPTDEGWSQQVDTLVSALCHGKEPVVCGGRDSFIPHYCGKFPTWTLPDQCGGDWPSATTMREAVIPGCNTEFISGAIWATQQQFPRVDSTVDALITKYDDDGLPWILVGQKPDGRWVFPGGYVDVRETAEQAVSREVLEETDLAVKDGRCRLLGTYVVDDWRYRGEKRMSVLTHVFHVEASTSGARAKDDLVAVKWIHVVNVNDCVIPAHQELWNAFKEKLNV